MTSAYQVSFWKLKPISMEDIPTHAQLQQVSFSPNSIELCKWSKSGTHHHPQEANTSLTIPWLSRQLHEDLALLSSGPVAALPTTPGYSTNHEDEIPYPPVGSKQMYKAQPHSQLSWGPTPPASMPNILTPTIIEGYMHPIQGQHWGLYL